MMRASVSNVILDFTRDTSPMHDLGKWLMRPAGQTSSKQLKQESIVPPQHSAYDLPL